VRTCLLPDFLTVWTFVASDGLGTNTFTVAVLPARVALRSSTRPIQSGTPRGEGVEDATQDVAYVRESVSDTSQVKVGDFAGVLPPPGDTKRVTQVVSVPGSSPMYKVTF